MACSCQGKVAPDRFVHIAPNGTKTTYSSAIEAQMAAGRKGGTWKVERASK